MPENKKSIQVNADLRPVFYDQFRCLAERCRFSCCKGWRISFDKKDYLSLKRQTGSPEFNALMERSLRRVRKGPLSDICFGEFDMSGGSCPLLREDGLCSLQREKGHQALPEVCKVFPRKNMYMPSGYLERCVGPECEGVLELLWNLPEGVEFLSDPLPKTEYRTLTLDSDSLHHIFGPVREWCIDMLQDRRFPISRRILLMGLALKELTKENVDVAEWLCYANALPELPEEMIPQSEGSASLGMLLSHNIHILMRLSNETSDFGPVPNEIIKSVGLESTGDAQIKIPLTPYLQARERFQKQFQDRDYFFENLMVTTFFGLSFPRLQSPEELWGSYVNFCNLYSFYHFMAVMSCRDGVEDCRAELFRLIVYVSREITHVKGRDTGFRDELFENGSSTLAHMAILLGG